MFANTPFAPIPTFKLVLGLGLCTLGGAMLYSYFKARDEEDDNDPKEISNNKNGYMKASKDEKKSEKPISIRLVVAQEQIPLLLGRCGTNLKSIEERTNTQIEFLDKDSGHKFCEITGLPNAVKEARTVVLNQVQHAPIVKTEMFVAPGVCAKIMGRCGETMQEISHQSLAKITIDIGGRVGAGHDRRRITIVGTKQQVAHARSLIQEKIEEDEEIQRSVEESEQKREPRRSPTNSVNSSMYSSQTSLSSHTGPREKLLASKIDEKPMEVYVSAVASPAKFWVQLIGPQTKKLDDLVENMTEYYQEATNRELHTILEPYLGQIVAAAFKYDGKWYRAEIVGILPNEYNPEELVLDLYFVDYGDSEYVAPHEVYELRTDFLTLRFQAVECFLANVKGTLNDAAKWDSQAIEKFEDLTQVANWKKLIARVVTYKERPKSTNDAGVSSAAREGSPVPGVEIFDMIEGVEVNLGHMLISHGFALPLEDQQPRSPIYRTATPESTQYPSSPFTTSTESSAEDALLDQQLQHLQKDENLYLNGRKTTDQQSSLSYPAKIDNACLNGNHTKASERTRPTTTTTDSYNRNGNLIR